LIQFKTIHSLVLYLDVDIIDAHRGVRGKGGKTSPPLQIKKKNLFFKCNKSQNKGPLAILPESLDSPELTPPLDI
jgi:hypothetical protein